MFILHERKRKVIYYDPTDENCSCIAIERDTGAWRLLPAGSVIDYPKSELRKPNSELKEQ